MKEVAFGNQTVLVDEDRTRALYRTLLGGFGLDWCQCDGCTNARMTRVRFMPSDQVQFIRSFGLDPQVPVHSAVARRHKTESRNTTRRMSFWYLYASFDRSTPAPKQLFSSKGMVWLDESETSEEKHQRGHNYAELEMDGMVILRASNSYPWLYDQVTEFISVSAVGCSECGFAWREVGFLKKDSLIPDWYEMPELRRVLLSRKERVKVSLCSHCGHLDYELTKR